MFSYGKVSTLQFETAKKNTLYRISQNNIATSAFGALDRVWALMVNVLNVSNKKTLTIFLN
jgi:hypothetical protein